MHHDDKNVLSISILMFKYISSDLKEKNIENGIFLKMGQNQAYRLHVKIIAALNQIMQMRK